MVTKKNRNQRVGQRPVTARMAGLKDDPVREDIREFANTLLQGVKLGFDWNHSKRNQETWASIKLWFMTHVGKGRMTEALKAFRQFLTDRNFKVNVKIVR